MKICAERPLPAQCQAKYGGLACDGCGYFATVKYEKQIIAFSRCFEILNVFKTCRKYTSLFYDCCEKCFWAAAECSSSLYKLNECFQEIDCIRLPPHFGVVTAICASSGDYITICTPKFMVEIEKSCPKNYTELISCPSGACVSGAVSPPYYICLHMKKSKQHICVFGECGECLFDYCVPDCYIVNAILPCPSFECHSLCFRFLATKHCSYPYILDVCLGDCGEHECLRCFCDCCCDCPAPPTPCNSCADVMESIALVEASIAHILNAEGEKLQKIIAISDDPCVLLEANKSVKKTITSATHLEQLLYAKLEAICECCNIECDPNCGQSCNPPCCKK